MKNSKILNQKQAPGGAAHWAEKPMLKISMRSAFLQTSFEGLPGVQIGHVDSSLEILSSLFSNPTLVFQFGVYLPCQK